MAKKIDPRIAEVLKQYGFGPEAAWDCHGTWVVYHRVLEQVAVKAGIVFDQPHIVQADGLNKVAAICVTGTMGDKTEWSIGEAAPGNNKNAYPFAMAEKRGKDRVILKLIGLHGIAYSEEEADAFTPPKNEDAAPDESTVLFLAKARKEIAAFKDVQAMTDWWLSDEQKNARHQHGITQKQLDELKGLLTTQKAAIEGRKAA